MEGAQRRTQGPTALALTLLASLLTALACLTALAWTLALLSLLTLAALLTGTIHLISHGKFSALVDRGCAPTSEPPRRALVPILAMQNVRIPLKFCCS